MAWHRFGHLIAKIIPTCHSFICNWYNIRSAVKRLTNPRQVEIQMIAFRSMKGGNPLSEWRWEWQWTHDKQIRFWSLLWSYTKMIVKIIYDFIPFIVLVNHKKSSRWISHSFSSCSIVNAPDPTWTTEYSNDFDISKFWTIKSNSRARKMKRECKRERGNQ